MLCVMAGSSLRFAPPPLRLSNSSRGVEAETSQANWSRREGEGYREASPLMAKAARPQERRERSEVKPVEGMVMEALTGGNPLKGSEPDLESGEDSSEDEEEIKMSRDHSSSGTTILGTNDNDDADSEEATGDGEDGGCDDGDQTEQPVLVASPAKPRDALWAPSPLDGIECFRVVQTGGAAGGGVQILVGDGELSGGDDLLARGGGSSQGEGGGSRPAGGGGRSPVGGGGSTPTGGGGST
jgi:hypothetical protein